MYGIFHSPSLRSSSLSLSPVCKTSTPYPFLFFLGMSPTLSVSFAPLAFLLHSDKLLEGMWTAAIHQGRQQPGAENLLGSRLPCAFALKQILDFAVRAGFPRSNSESHLSSSRRPLLSATDSFFWGSRVASSGHSMEGRLGLCFVSSVTANEPENSLKGQAPADRGLISFVCTRVLCLRNHYPALDGVIFFSLSGQHYKFNYLVTATLIKKASP